MNDRFRFRVWDKGNEHYVDCADMLKNADNFNTFGGNVKENDR